MTAWHVRSRRITRLEGLMRYVRQNVAFYALLSPALVYCFVYCYATLPFIYIAFTRYNFQAGIFRSDFIGLKNFEFFFKSQAAVTVTWNTIKFNLLGLIMGTVLALALAVLFNEVRSRKFVKTAQSIILFPYFISWVAVHFFINNLLASNDGMVNALLKSMGADPVRWYSTPGPWTLIITLIILWKGSGMNSVIFLAAITGIDQELYEAARIDGSNRWQNVFYITIPCVFPTVVVLLLLGLGRVFYGDFGMMYALIGDNGVLYQTTDIIDTYVYRALRKTADPSAAMAVSLVQSLLGFTTVLFTNQMIKRTYPEGAIF